MPTTSSGDVVYASLDELKVYIQTQPGAVGLSGTKDEDADGLSEWEEQLEILQSKAKGRIDRFCRRDFELHEGETVTLDGKGGTSVLDLPYHVREVHEVRVDGDVIESDRWHAKDSGALVYTADAPESGRYGNPGGPPVRTRERGQWPAGYGNIEVDLDYGYPDGEAPVDVQEAEMKLVDHTIVGMAQKREGMVVQADSFEVEVNIPVAWNSEIRGMLTPHRKVGVGN